MFTLSWTSASVCFRNSVAILCYSTLLSFFTVPWATMSRTVNRRFSNRALGIHREADPQIHQNCNKFRDECHTNQRSYRTRQRIPNLVR